jgi:ATP-dependent Clp protease ATP-binding subunit ClpC
MSKLSDFWKRHFGKPVAASQPDRAIQPDRASRPEASIRFDRFTERARKVLSLAQDEAQRFNHNYIGTEHLLLGLVRERDGVAAQVLSNLGVELNKVRSAVEFIIGRGDRIVLGEIGLTPRSIKVLELAVDEARRLNHHYVGTEHLLLGLVREGEGIAAGVLESLGVSLEKVRTETIRVLTQTGSPNQPNARKETKTPTIDALGIDLTAAARASQLDPIVGREKEIERVIQVLSRRETTSPALIGEPGIRKTAIVEGLAQRIVHGEVPESLAGKRLIAIEAEALGGRISSAVELEQQLKKFLEEFRSSQDCVIFIDQVHLVVGPGTSAAANILRPAFSRGELQCIGATTLDEYRNHIEKDAALQRRFQEVIVRESTVEETIEILKGIRERYEAHHRVVITDEALRAAAEMASRYITDRYLPDKAIDLIDEASSRVRMQRSLAPLVLKEAMVGLEAVLREKEMAIQGQHYEQASELREREVKLRERVAVLESGWHQDQGNEKPVVGEEDVAQIVSMWTGIPLSHIVRGLPQLQSATADAMPLTTSSITAFISYSHHNQDVVARLRSDLRAAGVSLWVDHESLQPGTRDWSLAIEHGIKASQVFIYAASPEARNSQYVNHEYAIAERLPIAIIPLWIAGDAWLDAALFGMARMQYIDLRVNYASGLDQLLSQLGLISRLRTDEQ